MATKPKTRKAPTAKAIDPIFAAIAEHKALIKKTCRLYKKLDDAEFEAGKAHGMRRFELIAWRNYSMIGGGDFDRVREELWREPSADRKQIEMEYRDAKARLVAIKHECVERNHRAGIAPLREQYELADLAAHKAALRMARTKPTTPAGAAAMVYFIWRDIKEDHGDPDWLMGALKTVSTALAGMKAA